MKRIFVVAILFLFAYLTFSQPVDSAHFRLDFIPKLQNFYKITSPADIPNDPQQLIDVEYEIVPQSMDISFTSTPLKPVRLQEDMMKKLYRNFIKIGFGYPVTPLVELCVHNFDNSKYSYGINANHISGWAPPIGKQMKNYAYAPFSDTRILLFLNTFLKNQTLYSSIGYNNEIAHLYGFSRKLGFNSIYYEKLYRDTLKNNFHHLRAEIGLRSNFLQEDAKLKQDVRLNYDLLYTYKKDMENHIGLTSFFAYDFLFKKLNGYLRPQLDFNIDYFKNKWNNSVSNTDAFKVELVPTVKFAVKEYHIRLGLGIPIINSDVQGEAKAPVFPIVELQLGIVPGILSIYAGIDGNTKYNSLQGLFYENPFLKSGLDSLKFAKTQISIFGGVKGNLLSKLNYHISARYSNTKDMAFFFLDTASLLKNQFDVVYSQVNLINVCANLNWQVVNKLYLNLEANYWGYFNLKSIEKPWYKPNWEISFAGKYYFKEKFIFDMNMKLGFGCYALFPYLDEKNKVNYQTKVMYPILNFGVGIEYLITKRFSCFATINNIGFQHFSKYYDFRNLGFNAIIGLTCSFGDESLKRVKK